MTRSDVAQFGRLESGLVTHGCAMCGATVAHDSHMLNGHVNAVHRMSLKDYFMKYIDTHESASRSKGTSGGSSIEATSNAKSNWMNQCEFKVSRDEYTLHALLLIRVLSQFQYSKFKGFHPY